jgi:hypothetical protein
MRKGITNISDRLPALGAVMERVSQRTGWEPIWGMWRHAMVQSLGWSSGDNDASAVHRCKTNSSHCAPSWSWLSIEGPITHFKAFQPPRSKDNPIMWDLQFRSVHPFLGDICAEAPCAFFKLRVTVQRVGDDTLEEPFKVEYRYTYDLLLAQDRRARFSPDVPLIPYAGDAKVEFTASVIRVTEDKTVPLQSWTGICLCALLSSTKQGSVALILGQRPDGFYQRIGLTVGLHPASFIGSDRKTLWIT